MTWILDQERTMLRDSAQTFLGERAPVAHLRKLRDADDERGYSPDLWREFAAHLHWHLDLGEDCFDQMQVGTRTACRIQIDDVQSAVAQTYPTLRNGNRIRPIHAHGVGTSTLQLNDITLLQVDRGINNHARA